MYYFVRRKFSDGSIVTAYYEGKQIGEPTPLEWTTSNLVEIDDRNTERVIKTLFDENPSIDTVIPLRISGRTYSERKESLRNLVMEISLADNGGLSYMEESTIEDFVRTNAYRYGLVEEFEENAII